MNHLLKILLGLTVTIVSAACATTDEDAESLQTVVEIAAAEARVSTLVSALDRTGLIATLSGPGTFTVFAPTNDAFTASGIDLATLSDEELTAVLLYHVVAGQQFAADLQTGPIETLSDKATIAATVGDTVQLNNSATVIAADFEASNGVIHLIDQVLLPPKPTIATLASNTSDLSTLVAALQKADLVDTLNDSTASFTVFAPTNAAFDALLSDLGADSLDDLTAEQLKPILLYHVATTIVASSELATSYVPTANDGTALAVVVSGDTVTIDGAKPISVDIEAVNGIVHVIDTVLLPVTSNVVELAIASAPEFEELVAALVKTGLDTTLSGDGPFTVFAPTDAAFDAISSTTAGLSNDELAEILKYHVVSGRVFSTDLSSGQVPTLSEGDSLDVNVTGLTIDDANLVADSIDIQGTNGVIHVIDKVLIP